MAFREVRDPTQELLELCANREGAPVLFMVGPLLDISPQLVADERVRSVVHAAILHARGSGWSANDVRYVLGERIAASLFT